MSRSGLEIKSNVASDMRHPINTEALPFPIKDDSTRYDPKLKMIDVAYADGSKLLLTEHALQDLNKEIGDLCDIKKNLKSIKVYFVYVDNLDDSKYVQFDVHLNVPWDTTLISILTTSEALKV